ncbi:hypothetical protein BV25DRAFT_1910906 [Artomyces pyxidatus]|uniref:Uncharacterized protein n=1 Tax=Artomyces pyxidatus TaxID=48021 RepID=A0ACB8TLA7_9AGAM|nr:hypothetical protein BV25DRAFT_1910906 [Artomyces pyxidatus]
MSSPRSAPGDFLAAPNEAVEQSDLELEDGIVLAQTADQEDTAIAAYLRNILLAYGYTQENELETVDEVTAAQLFQNHPVLREKLLDACSMGKFSDLTRIKILLKKPPSLKERTPPKEDYTTPDLEADKRATEASWNIEYQAGDAAKTLFETLTWYLEVKKLYARYIALVQSSGTGKSRLVDELGKLTGVIPLNFRRWSAIFFGFLLPTSNYFPQSGSVEDPPIWVCRRSSNLGLSKILATIYKPIEKSEPDRYKAILRACTLLTSIFIVAKQRLQDIDTSGDAHESPVQRALRFRDLMAEGQAFGHQGPYRVRFYNDVVEAAEQAIDRLILSKPTGEKGLDSLRRDAIKEMQKEAESLVAFLDHLKSLDRPVLVLAFDEAHTLTKSQYTTWSPFSEIRRHLSELTRMPIFSIFLATNENFHPFRPLSYQNYSRPLKMGTFNLLPPYTEFSFDLLAEKASSGIALSKVTSDEFIARLGRPLFGTRWISGDVRVRKSIIDFAQVKLLLKDPEGEKLESEQTLACLAVRLAVEFQETSWSSREQERVQVERHMRICLAATPIFEEMVTIAPSEPLLAETAFVSMRNEDAAWALLDHLKESGLNPAITGRNRVVSVTDFLKNLVSDKYAQDVLSALPARARDEGARETTLEASFKNVRICFNHFVTVHNLDVLHRGYLWRLIVRGAAVVCANNQRGVDIVVLFLYWDERIRQTNVSAILFQVKNDKRHPT